MFKDKYKYRCSDRDGRVVYFNKKPMPMANTWWCDEPDADFFTEGEKYHYDDWSASLEIAEDALPDWAIVGAHFWYNGYLEQITKISDLVYFGTFGIPFEIFNSFCREAKYVLPTLEEIIKCPMYLLHKKTSKRRIVCPPECTGGIRLDDSSFHSVQRLDNLYTWADGSSIGRWE